MYGYLAGARTLGTDHAATGRTIDRMTGHTKQARRISAPSWRDPRLLLGVLVVLISTIVGARAFAAQDDTARYWAARSDVTVGSEVDKDDFTAVSAHLSKDAESQYMRVEHELPADFDEMVWAHDVEAGALIDVGSLVLAEEKPAGELPLKVALGSAPADLRAGQRVDVWVGPGPGDPVEDGSKRVLSKVRVLSTGSADRTKSGSLDRTVLVAAGEGELNDKTLSAVSAGHVTLVRVP